jgi:hypothetical protein
MMVVCGLIVQKLTETELVNIGVDVIGDRIKILRANNEGAKQPSQVCHCIIR